MPENYPGIQGIGFSQSFTPAQKDALVQKMRASVHEDFRVWPEGARDEYTAIIYLYPPGNYNEQAIGYDMFAEPVRRQAMEQRAIPARPQPQDVCDWSRRPTTEEQPGFLIYAPVYRNGAATNSVGRAAESARRLRLQSLSHQRFSRSDHCGRRMTSVFRFTTATKLKTRTFCTAILTSVAERFSFYSNEKLDVAGRTWTLSYATRPSFERGSSRPLLKYTIIIGVLLSLLFFCGHAG